MQFMEFCGRDQILAAHNIDYDIQILQNNLKRHCNHNIKENCSEYYDTIEVTKRLLPNLYQTPLMSMVLVGQQMD